MLLIRLTLFPNSLISISVDNLHNHESNEKASPFKF